MPTAMGGGSKRGKQGGKTGRKPGGNKKSRTTWTTGPNTRRTIRTKSKTVRLGPNTRYTPGKKPKGSSPGTVAGVRG